MKRKKIMSVVPLFLMGSLLLSGLLFSSCRKSNDSSNSNTPVAGLMAFNLAPDKPSIGISLSGSSLLQTPLVYTGFTGAYLPVYPGNRNIEASDNSNSPFASSEDSLQAGRYYTVFVLGNNGSYKNVVTLDNFDSLAATPAQAYIRYINAIPDSSKPSVTVTAGGNNVINTSAAYSFVSGFVPVAAGDVNIALTNESSISTNRTITLQEKKIYTILLLGNPAATDSTGKVQIRFIQNGSL